MNLKATLFLMVELMSFLALSTPEPEIKKPTVPESQVGDLSGIYSVHGVRPIPGGTAFYTGTCLVKRHGEAYFVQSACGECSTGIGFRQGDVLSVGWSTTGARGVTVYRIVSGKAGPVLSGQWMSWPGNGVKYAETLRFVSPLPEEEE